MPFQPPALPAQIVAEDADRERWVAAKLAQARASGLASIRVQRRSDSAKGGPGAGPWFHIHAPSSVTYHLACIQPSQSVFDIGDDEVTASARKPTPWPQTAEWCDALMQAMTNLGIPFQAGPSGGKGFHIEWWLAPVSPSRIDLRGACANCGHSGGFGLDHCAAMVTVAWDSTEIEARCRCRAFEPHGAPPVDRRWQVANRILAEAHRILSLRATEVSGRDARKGGDEGPSRPEPLRIRFDARLIAPNVDSRECREWGERKAAGEPKRKLLLHDGHGPAPQVPRERAECYRVCEARAKECGVRPKGIQASDADRHDTQWILELTGRPCPQGPQCFDTGGWPTCERCPAMGAD